MRCVKSDSLIRAHTALGALPHVCPSLLPAVSHVHRPAVSGHPCAPPPCSPSSASMHPCLPWLPPPICSLHLQPRCQAGLSHISPHLLCISQPPSVLLASRPLSRPLLSHTNSPTHLQPQDLWIKLPKHHGPPPSLEK